MFWSLRKNQRGGGHNYEFQITNEELKKSRHPERNPHN